MKYYSKSHITRNENDRPEIELEYNNGIWRSLLKKARIKRKFEKWPEGWRDKENMKRVGADLQFELLRIERDFSRF